jgi:hypothetical protein
VIAFCNQEIRTWLPNISCLCLEGDNSFYEHLKTLAARSAAVY